MYVVLRVDLRCITGLRLRNHLGNYSQYVSTIGENGRTATCEAMCHVAHCPRASWRFVHSHSRVSELLYPHFHLFLLDR